jgi:polyphosphate kinase
LTDGALYFGVKMWGAKPRYAILEIPEEQPRFVQLPNGNIMYLDDVIRYMLNDVFYIFSYDSIAAYEFKISRDAELDIDNDFAEGYVRKMERSLQKRKGGRPTRLVFDASMPADLLNLLRRELKITKYDTLIGGGRYHNMKDLMRFPSHRPDLSFDEQEPAPHPVLDGARKPVLDVIQREDILITYPYQSFDLLIRLLREAAIDPKVLEIKMTLYRAARNSKIVNALYNAARNGKQIFVTIELQARFDEKNNIQIAEKLSEVGATVVYGVPPMKTHGKLLLIVKEGGINIAGMSTGNFNEITGRLYVDSTLLTADPRITGEVSEVFDFLADAATMRMLNAPKFKNLLVSPFNPRKTIKKLLAREKDKGPDGYVFMKINHLTDVETLEAIKEAADAGVKMDLVVRTTYAMLPHPNIRAISILDRYLEHQRVYIFGKGKDRVIYMSSADLMERNLDWRVEVAFPIYDPRLQQQVLDMMAFQIADDAKARVLDETQSNQYVSKGSGSRRAQYDTYAYFRSLPNS